MWLVRKLLRSSQVGAPSGVTKSHPGLEHFTGAGGGMAPVKLSLLLGSLKPREHQQDLALMLSGKVEKLGLGHFKYLTKCSEMKQTYNYGTSEMCLQWTATIAFTHLYCML